MLEGTKIRVLFFYQPYLFLDQNLPPTSHASQLSTLLGIYQLDANWEFISSNVYSHWFVAVFWFAFVDMID